MSYLIAAVDANMGLGKNNDLPWKDTEEGKKDMKYFREQTRGSAVLMGYNTWKSIGRLLPGRLNIIVTKSHYAEMQSIEETHNFNLKNNFDSNKSNTEIKVFDDLRNALLFALSYELRTNKRCYICGGRTIYKQYLEMFIPKIIYLTKFSENYNCDVKFPNEELHKFVDDECGVKISRSDIFRKYEHCAGGRFR